MPDGHRLGNHSAERGTNDVRGFDPEGVEEADGIAGHVLQAVSASRQVRRAARVAVVEPNHAETLGGELTAKVLRPVDKLEAHTHDEQHRGAMGVTEFVVAQVHVAHGRESRPVVPHAIGSAYATGLLHLGLVAVVAAGGDSGHRRTPCNWPGNALDGGSGTSAARGFGSGRQDLAEQVEPSPVQCRG
jgi:hypothetical protein